MLMRIWNRLRTPSGGFGLAARIVCACFACAVVLTRPAEAIEVIDSAGGTIYVEVNKGRLLRLDEAPATVFLANPAIADLQFRSSRLVYLFGLTTGETSLFALDKKDQVLLNRKIVVGYDLDQLNAAINALIPNSGVTASMINTTLVLDGVVSSPAEAQQVAAIATSLAAGGQLLNRISVSMPNQVNLRVKIAEVERNVAKDFGFDLSALSSGFTFSTNTAGGSAGSRVDFNRTIGTVNLAGLLEALETEGMVTVLSEPNLTAVSGETASFLAGGELPIAAVDVDGNVTIEFKQFGVSLEFTPTLLDDSRISLKVAPEVSQISGITTIAGVNAATLSTRRADTTVELGNGESLALGGLLSRSVITDTNKVPGLGDIPILGALFRSKGFQKNETELVIVVTPYIVRPTSERLATPVDGYEASNDYEQNIWGMMYRDSTGSAPERVSVRRGQNLIGSVGFQIE